MPMQSERVRRRARALCGCLLALAGCGAALAAPDAEEPPGLEELLRQGLNQVPRGVQVSTASRFSQSAEDAPALTYVLTDGEIRDFGMRRFTDVLRALPGIYITSNGNFSYVGARGLGRPGDYNSRLLLLIDGVRTNDAVTDSALVGPEFFLDVDLIERVEFTPGPGSALYGNNAFLGVINVITKRADKLAGVRARLSVDSLKGRDWAFSLGRRFDGGAEAWIAASGFERRDIEHPRPHPDEFDSPLRALSWDRAKRLAASVSWQGLTLRAGLSERRRGLPNTMSDTELRLGQFRSTYRDAYLSLAYERRLGADWDLSVDGSLHRSRNQGDSPFLEADGAVSHFVDEAKGRWGHFDLNVGYSGFPGHYLLLGVERQLDFSESIEVSINAELLEGFGGRIGRTGLFVQDEWKLAADALLVAGLRRDKDDRALEDSLDPRLALVWHPFSDASLRLSYGTAFRAANLNEYSINTQFDVPVPEPERVRSFELGWEHRPTPRLQYRISAYRSRLLGLISSRDDAPIFENSPRISAEGVELGMEHRWAQGARLSASLGLQHSRTPNGVQLDNSPERLLKLHFSQPIWADRLSWAWEWIGMSRRLSTGHIVPGYSLHNLNLQWKLERDTVMQLGIYNALDTRVFDRTDLSVGLIKQEGRLVRLSLSRRFGS